MQLPRFLLHLCNSAKELAKESVPSKWIYTTFKIEGNILVCRR